MEDDVDGRIPDIIPEYVSRLIWVYKHPISGIASEPYSIYTKRYQLEPNDRVKLQLDIDGLCQYTINENCIPYANVPATEVWYMDITVRKYKLNAKNSTEADKKDGGD